jgi:DNA-binding NtrC family response regulator
MAETLLYVDDDILRLDAVSGRLRHLGYQVLSAANGSEALEMFKRSSIDLAIVDYYLPGLSGDLLAMEIKKLNSQVPVIIFSGTFTLAEMVLAYVDGFVSSSSDPEALLDKISEILSRRRAARAS